MIRHTVAFKLKHPAGSAAERDFLETARRLAAILDLGTAAVSEAGAAGRGVTAARVAALTAAIT
jgi:hypothetical protein